jgi:hypothetical protein
VCVCVGVGVGVCLCVCGGCGCGCGSRMPESVQHITCSGHHVDVCMLEGRAVALIFFIDMKVAGTYLVSSFIGCDCRTDRCLLLVKFGRDFQ